MPPGRSARTIPIPPLITDSCLQPGETRIYFRHPEQPHHQRYVSTPTTSISSASATSFDGTLPPPKICLQSYPWRRGKTCRAHGHFLEFGNRAGDLTESCPYVVVDGSAGLPTLWSFFSA